MRSGLNTRMLEVVAHDEGVVLIPFGFTINGTSDPDGIIGDLLSTVTRNEAGEFLCTLKRRPAECFAAFAGVCNTADDKDMYARVDWSLVVSAGTFVVFAQTGATQTDPDDNLLVGGVLVCSKTTRSAHR